MHKNIRFAKIDNFIELLKVLIVCYMILMFN